MSANWNARSQSRRAARLFAAAGKRSSAWSQGELAPLVGGRPAPALGPVAGPRRRETLVLHDDLQRVLQPVGLIRQGDVDARFDRGAALAVQDRRPAPPRRGLLQLAAVQEEGRLRQAAGAHFDIQRQGRPRHPGGGEELRRLEGRAQAEAGGGDRAAGAVRFPAHAVGRLLPVQQAGVERFFQPGQRVAAGLAGEGRQPETEENSTS